jgi:hypothetical protein
MTMLNHQLHADLAAAHRNDLIAEARAARLTREARAARRRRPEASPVHTQR